MSRASGAMPHSCQTVSVDGGMLPDRDACVRAVRGRDERFDGWFFTGTGRLVEVDGAIFFDPLP